MPAGADAVVMQEDVVLAAESSLALAHDAVKPWENVRFRGEDVRVGHELLASGERISIGKLALLAATGVGQVSVGRSPRVAILASGDELRPAGTPLAPGEIYESNAIALAELIRGAGGIPLSRPSVRDTESDVGRALTDAFDGADIVLTAGGASVGEHDLFKQIFEGLGGEVDFWKIAIKPGKPFFFGRWRGRFLCGVPGNPVSAFVTAFLLVRPLLLKLQGATDLTPPSFPANLAEVFSNQDSRRHFVRVCVDAEGKVRPAGLQASHRLSSLARADGLVDVPPNTSLAAGSRVRVLRWE
jgi:molybdopterin molybdotransferase